MSKLSRGGMIGDDIEDCLGVLLASAGWDSMPEDNLFPLVVNIGIELKLAYVQKLPPVSPAGKAPGDLLNILLGVAAMDA
jgi:hypothetical protein